VRPFRNLSVRRKLAVTFWVTVLPLLAAGLISLRYLHRSLRQGAEVELTNVVNHLYQVCDTLWSREPPGSSPRPDAGDVALVRAIVGSMRVGETGYPYCMDAQGNLVVHPSKEGQNIYGSRDSRGVPFIQEICRSAAALAPGEVGTIRYPWRNEEAGEKTARMKILKFRYFRPWNWVIAAGSYEEEIFSAVDEVRRYTGPAALASVLLAVGLTLGLNRALTRPLQRLADAAGRMAAGDLGARVDLAPRGDEFGALAGSFNAMAEQVREKTLEMERLIEERTQALAESRERYRSLVQSSADAIVTTDLQGVITLVNPGLEAMLGYAREELLGQEVWRFYPRGRAQAVAVMRMLRAQGSFANYEMEMLGRDRVVPIRASAAFLRDSQGREQGTLGIFSDLTEEKRLRADLQRTQASLVQTMKLRALGDLVSGVAHEVNNPLMAATTLVYLMETSPCPDGCPNRERISVLRRCNERIAKIVEHLKEFSRQTRHEKRLLSVNVPLENALLLVGQQLLGRGVEVRKDLDPQLPDVHGDENALEQVFLNLIGNARDAMEGGAGERVLTLRTAAATLAGQPAVAVEVRDTGPGIPEEILDKIFEPFFTTKEVGKGTGLGLSISYGIIEDHGGQIEALNGPPAGTLFRVLLPAARERADGSGREAP